MSVWYLDLDDEITDAVARLRAARDDRVVLVIPPGSRIGTGRINFRLLAREADQRSLHVAMVCGDPQVRALAAAAGLRAHASVIEAEAALGITADGLVPIPAAPAVGVAADAAGSAGALAAASLPVTISTAPGPTAGGAAAAVPVATTPARPPRLAARFRGRGRTDAAAQSYSVTPRASASVPGADTGWTDTSGLAGDAAKAAPRKRRGRVARWTPRLVIVGGAGAAALFAAYQVLPTATIELTPFTQATGKRVFTVTADPTTASDPAAGLLMADAYEWPLATSGRYPATGTGTAKTRAEGTVTFTSLNTVAPFNIPEDTKVSTSHGVDFVTTELKPVPVATSGPVKVDVHVRAVKAGEEGNVPAGAISIIASEQLATLLTPDGGVNNKQATKGGGEQPFKAVTDKDYQLATQDLARQIQEQFTADVNDPAKMPEGALLATAVMDEPAFDPLQKDIVNAQQDPFEVTATATGRVLLVDRDAIADSARKQLQASLPAGTQLFADTVVLAIGEPAIEGSTVSYQVTADGQAYTALDEADLKSRVKGKPVSQVPGILEPFGAAQVHVWPEFIDTIPDDVGRVFLHVAQPVERPE